MKVLLIAGIFGSPAYFRALNLQETSETLLADGLRERGVDVIEESHSLYNRFSGADLVHIHHLANSCAQLVLPRSTPIVFTRHATKSVPLHHRLTLGVTYRRASAVVTLSETERELAMRFVPAGKLHVIPNGVRTADFGFVNRSEPVDGSWRFLYVGQLIELKRVHQAISLVGALRSRSIDATLSIISHRDTLLPTLREQVSSQGLQPFVEFLGPRPRAEIGLMMQRSHFLVLPSRTEALPTVVTEACLTGLPVLAYAVGGIREQVPATVSPPQINDFNGFIEQALQAISHYSAICRQYAEHATVARRKFSVTSMIDSHISLYSSVLRSAGHNEVGT